jgi:hypothetical protein
MTFLRSEFVFIQIKFTPLEILAGHQTPPELFWGLTPLLSSGASFLTG